MSDQDTLVAPSVKDIVQFEVPAIFRRQHLNRDVVIGLIGDRGDGKSIGGGIIAICDYMVQNEPCFSNLDVKASFRIDEEAAAKYGMGAGVVDFRSRELDMGRFLSFDEEYCGGVFFVDEINVALADARRSMSNQNLWATDVGQQMRKLESALIYTSIHEMFVESRIRDMTDVFIVTRDLALTPEGLAAKRKPGTEFEWTIYPMSRKLTGERYQDTKQTIKARIRGREWWGSIDTLRRQDRQKYKMGAGATDMEMSITENAEVMAARSKWGWLYEAILELHNQGYEKIHSRALWDYLRLKERGFNEGVVATELQDRGLVRKLWDEKPPRSVGGCYYGIETFDLDNMKPKEAREAVVV